MANLVSEKITCMCVLIRGMARVAEDWCRTDGIVTKIMSCRYTLSESVMSDRRSFVSDFAHLQCR
jgi:hypothetical protein